MAYFESSSVPSISEVWRENEIPLSQTREQTREDIRRIVAYPVSLEGLGTITRSMNSMAELSVDAVYHQEALIHEYKTLETKKADIEGGAGSTDGRPWEGPAPLKKADVVEYDTSLLASENWVQLQTLGLASRMEQIKVEIVTAMNLMPIGPNAGIHGQARMYRN